MKKIIIISFFVSLFISCTVNNNSFWETIKLNTAKQQHIEDIILIGKDTIFITGWFIPENPKEIESYIPYMLMSFNNGKSWQKKTDFKCNKLVRIFYVKDDILIIEASKYVGDSKLLLGSQTVWLKFFIKEQRWEELNTTAERVGNLVKVIDENTYIFRDNKGYVNHNYVMTSNAGESWIKCSLPFDNKRDIVKILCIKGNKLWGVLRHEALIHDKNEKEFQMLISVNIDTWKITDKIPIGTVKINEKGYRVSTHNITNMIVGGEILYFLGQDEFTNTGYIWKINVNNNELEVQDSFKLTPDQSPVDLFYHKGQLIVVYIDVSTFLPSYTLLYKELGEKSWHKEAFPELTYPCISFSDGVLMGISEGNKIYYKQF